MEILFEDRHVVVAVKPRGVLSEYHEQEENMVALLGGNVYPVHRLDRNVGGVMVYAKTQKAAAVLSAAIGRGELHKEYTAVVTGTLPAPQGELRDLLFKDSRANKSYVVQTPRKGAKEALLSYSLIDQKEREGTLFTRMRIALQTGRSHQIRVQFSSRGCPLVGDGKYGSRQKAAYPALYATALRFVHPQSGKPLHFATPVPSDFPWDLFGSSAYEIERKFLIAYPDTALLAAQEGCRVRRMIQTYLNAPVGETRRVREVREGDAVRYIRTVKHRVDMLRAVEEENGLSKAEYTAALAEADPTRRPIAKTRYCIPHAGHTVEVDVYDFWQDRATAEVELASEKEPFSLPPYLTVIREVTEDKRYKNVNLARELPDE